MCEDAVKVLDSVSAFATKNEMKILLADLLSYARYFLTCYICRLLESSSPLKGTDSRCSHAGSVAWRLARGQLT